MKTSRPRRDHYFRADGPTFSETLLEYIITNATRATGMRSKWNSYSVDKQSVHARYRNGEDMHGWTSIP